MRYKRGWRVEDDNGNAYSKKALTKKMARQQQKALYASVARKEHLSGKGYASWIDEEGNHTMIFQGAGFWSSVLAKVKSVGNKVLQYATPENIQRASTFVSSFVRNDYSPQVRSVLQEYGQGQVYHIELRRTPIKAYVNDLMNIISVGKWNQAREKYAFDKVFHLSMIVSLSMPDGEKARLRIEKNEVIDITPNFPAQEEGMEVLEVPVPCCITLQQLLDRAKQRMGEKFFPYHAFTNNCQAFILGILKANDLSSPPIDDFIQQDIRNLVEEMPSYVSPVAGLATSLAGVWNTLYRGRGGATLRGGYYVFPDGTATADPPAMAIAAWNRAHPDQPIETNEVKQWKTLSVKEQVDLHNQAKEKVLREGYDNLTELEKQAYQSAADIRGRAEVERRAALSDQQREAEEMARSAQAEEIPRIMDYDRYGDNEPVYFTPEEQRAWGVQSARRFRCGGWEVHYTNGSTYYTMPPIKWNWDIPGYRFRFENDQQRVDSLEEIANIVRRDFQIEWDNMSGWDKFMSGLTDVLENIADVASQIISVLPGVGVVASKAAEAYDTFKPGTREERIEATIQQVIQEMLTAPRIGDRVAHEFTVKPELASLVQYDPDMKHLLSDIAVYGSLGEKFIQTGWGFDVAPCDAIEQPPQTLAGFVDPLTGQGNTERPSKAFLRQLRKANITPQNYMAAAKQRAASAGYNPNDLTWGDDEYKLCIKDGDREICFGRVGYGDFLIWSALEAQGRVQPGFAKKKRAVFHASHSKIRGDWKNDKFSPNMLALSINW